MVDWVYRRPWDYRPFRSPIFTLLAVAGSTSGVVALTLGGVGALTGTGALAGTAAITIGATGDAAGGNPIAGTASQVLNGSATLRADGALAGSAAITFGGTNTINSVVGLTPTRFQRAKRFWPETPFWETGRLVTIFPYSPPTAFVGTADIVFGGNGLLRGAGAMAGVGNNVFGGAGALQGSGALVGVAALSLNGSGTMTGTASGSISGDSNLIWSASGTLDGTANLMGHADMVMDASAPIGEITGLAGTITVSFTVTGALPSQRTRPPRSRRIIVPPQRRRFES